MAATFVTTQGKGENEDELVYLLFKIMHIIKMLYINVRLQPTTTNASLVSFAKEANKIILNFL